MNKKKRNLTRQWIKLFSSIAFIYALARTSWWSYTQTEEFLRIFNSVGDTGMTMSHVLSIIVQYGQNVVLWIGMQERKEYLFLQMKLDDLIKSKRGASPKDKERIEKIIFKYEQETRKKFSAMVIWLGGYLSFLIVDIFTNVGQFLLTFNSHGSAVITESVGSSPTIVTLAKIGGVIMMFVVAFVEEAIPGVLTALGTSMNDILEYYGIKRLTGWDFLGEAVESDERIANSSVRGDNSQKKHKSQRTQTNRSESKRQQKVEHTQVGKSTNTKKNTQRQSYRRDPQNGGNSYQPTYHPVGMSQSMTEESPPQWLQDDGYGNSEAMRT